MLKIAYAIFNILLYCGICAAFHKKREQIQGILEKQPAFPISRYIPFFAEITERAFFT